VRTLEQRGRPIIRGVPYLLYPRRTKKSLRFTSTSGRRLASPICRGLVDLLRQAVVVRNSSDLKWAKSFFDTIGCETRTKLVPDLSE
jgi:hypothetical protein